MNNASQFSWTRLEGIGLIITALGITLLSQLPPTYFAFMVLNFDFDIYFLAMIGTILGSTIIITSIACSLTEDWDETQLPSLRTTVNLSLTVTIIFLFGFFIFFILQSNFPAEIQNLDSSQRYLSAYATGLTLVAIITIAFYKLRAYFS
ncbi:MAG: hypothetical protein ACTSR4_00140 [Candidatus Hodarchaeales archaeon]